MNNETRLPALQFEPETTIANLIRSEQDAQSLLNPFEFLCHQQDETEKHAWLATLYQLRALLGRWDQPPTDDETAQFEVVIDDYFSHVEPLNHEEASDPHLLGKSLRIAYLRRTETSARF